MTLGSPAARATPPNCQPNPGGYDCVAPTPTPYEYIAVICSSNPGWGPSPQAAKSAFEAEAVPVYTQCPGSTYNGLSWLTSVITAGGACQTGGVLGPEYGYGGLEQTNAMVAEAEYDEPAPACSNHHALHKTYAVRRQRSIPCPRGYGRFGGICALNQLDPAKNLGGQCPTCGNPISPGSGNKLLRRRATEMQIGKLRSAQVV